MSTPTNLPSTPVVSTAKVAVFTAFALNGAAFASFASRVPDLKFELGLSAGELGLTLLAASVGSVIGLPISGWFVHRFGAARTLIGAAVVQAIGLAGVGIGVDVMDARAFAAIALVFVGAGTGTFDVGMNFEGAGVERLLGRAIMPRFHAAFSAATVVSALIGAGLSYLQVSIAGHLIGAAVVLAVTVPLVVRRFLPREVEAEDDALSIGGTESSDTTDGGKASAGLAVAWRESRTLLIGVVVFAAAFTEGVANDWVAVALSEGYELPRWAGVLGFAVFLTAMTLGRVLGTGLLDRYGRLVVLRVMFVSAALGCLLVVFGGPWLAFVGAAVWGVGASLGFPVGISAAADDPRRAAARISVVSTIGYTAFVAGPPLLGFLGEQVGVLRSLLVVGAMALVALLAIPSVREPSSTDTAANT